ncbi:hypothetical protein TrispH2_002528 [Trichoplax sp. H2]|nr:hypothetical protein TrispH2_002528 [Trichoplax sp. H2]|eukprot:RDD45149.1 hypothetical protein TrispH2_002528 [Trichoplax sp. H2]
MIITEFDLALKLNKGTFTSIFIHFSEELRLELLKMVWLLFRFKGIYLDGPALLTSDDKSLLIELISSPYEDLALTALTVITAFAGKKNYYIMIRKISFIDCKIIQKLIPIVHAGKSIPFLQIVVCILIRCLVMPCSNVLYYQVDEYYEELRHDISDMIQIVCLLLKSDNFDIRRGIIEIITILFDKSCDMVASPMLFISRYMDTKVKEAMNAIPVFYTYEIIASQSPRLCGPSIQAVNLMLFNNEKSHKAKILIGLKVIPALKVILLNARNNHNNYRDSVKDAIYLFMELAITDSTLVQGIIDQDIFATIIKMKEILSPYDCQIVEALVATLRNATKNQIEQLIENQYIPQYLYSMLMKYEISKDDEILEPARESTELIFRECQQMPVLWKENMITLLNKLDAIYLNREEKIAQSLEHGVINIEGPLPPFVDDY